MMERFIAIHKENGLTSMLKEVHIQCTTPTASDNITMCIPFARIADSLREFVIRLAMRLSQQEPIMRQLYFAYIEIDSVTHERYDTTEAVLLRYADLIQTHLTRLYESTSDFEAYICARLLLVCFAHSTFEASHRYIPLMCVLAEEATRHKQGKPSILEVYHATWSAVCDNCIPDVIDVLS